MTLNRRWPSRSWQRHRTLKARHRLATRRRNTRRSSGYRGASSRHAHIEHSGAIPILCRDGFAGKIYATDATADLCRIMLLDSAHIQEQDALFMSKKLGKPVEPLYTQADATSSLEHFESVRYNQP